MKEESVSYHPAKTACRLRTAFLKYPRVNTYTILTNGEPTAEKIDAERVGPSTSEL